MATKARKTGPEAEISKRLNEDGRGISAGPKPLILFVHGIRDPGFWTNDLCQLFEGHGFVAKAIGYGVFDAFRFLLGFRRRPAVIVKQQIDNAISDLADPGAEVTIIAHSFGTYIVSRILDDDPNIKIKRFIMCGAIVPQTFRWDKVARFNVQKAKSKFQDANAQGAKQKIQIINEHSARDIWPIMARHATYGFGDTGATGSANMVDVQNRRHDLPHSGYLSLDFAKCHWVPPIVRGEILKYPKVPARNPWFFFLTKSPVRIISMALLAVATGALYWVWDYFDFRTEGKFTKIGDVGVTVRIEGYTDLNKDHAVRLYTAPDAQNADVQQFRSDARLKIISVTIGNRFPLKCESAAIENEDAFTIGTRAPNLTTNYEFNLSDSYKMFGRAILDFTYHGKYTTEDAAPQNDLLTIAASGKLDPAKIRTVSIRHTEPCLAMNDPIEAEKKFVRRAIAASGPGNGGLGFSSSAWAAIAVPSLAPANVRDLLEKGDAAQRAVGLQAIVAEPAKYKEITESYFRDALMSHPALADVIRSMRTIIAGGSGSKSGAPIELDTGKMIELAHAGPPQVRDAARSYLRAPGVATHELALKFSGAEFAGKVRSLKGVAVNGGGRPYSQDYLLLITARDVFYNLGINELLPHIAAIRSKKPGALEAVLAPFEAGMGLSALTDKTSEKVALAKNSYGKALAMFESAVNLEAAAKETGEGAFKYIEAQKPTRKPLDDKPAALAITDQFKLFLAEVKGQENLYPWPSHIAQATRCVSSLTFACLNAELQEMQ
jgi:hypothetical protein